MGMIELLAILPYILLGSTLRIVWGMYKLFDSYLDVRLSWRRLVMEFLVDMLFGTFGGLFLSQLGIITLGVSLGSLVSSLLGANVVDLIAKKFGLSGKMNIVLSDQQLEFPELNPREINAIAYVRSQGKITNMVYQKINRTTRDVARYELSALAKKGKLKKLGEHRGIYYVSN